MNFEGKEFDTIRVTTPVAHVTGEAHQLVELLRHGVVVSIALRPVETVTVLSAPIMVEVPEGAKPPPWHKPQAWKKAKKGRK